MAFFQYFQFKQAPKEISENLTNLAVWSYVQNCTFVMAIKSNNKVELSDLHDLNSFVA